MASALDTFHSFKGLPIEIRAQVWHEASSVPRIVKMLVIEFVTSKSMRQVTYTSATPVPPTLHATRESRQCALQHYELSFGCFRDSISGRADTVYINFSKDIVYFPGREFVTDNFGTSLVHSLEHLNYSNCLSDFHTKLTKVAIPIQHASLNSATYSVALLSCLPKLAELILVGCEEVIDDNVSQSAVTRYNQRNYSSDPEAADMCGWQEAVDILDKTFKEQQGLAKQLRRKKQPKPRITVKVLFTEDVEG